MQANDLPVVAQAVSPAYRILSQRLTRAAPIRAATVRERFPCERESIFEEGLVKLFDTRYITRYGEGV
jgi:hypothetical protein